MIRKSGVLASLIFIIIILLFNFIFLNIIIKSSLIKAGELIFKAKTEIRNVKANLFSGKIVIYNMVVGDKKNEFKNLFEIEKINFQIRITPLFSKKIIIDAVEVENLTLSTDRKSSGFLSPKKLKKIEKHKKEKKPGIFDKLTAKIEEKAKNEIKKMPVSKITDLKDVKNIDYKSAIKLENLESVKKINEAKQKIPEEKQNIEANIKGLNIGPRADSIKNKAENLKDFKINTAQDIPEAQKKLQELDEIKKELTALNSDINKSKNQITNFSNFCNAKIKEINLSREKDTENIMKNMNLNILNANELEKALIGPVWYERVNTVLNLFSLVKKYIPKGGKKEKAKTIEQKRDKGTKIVFVKEKILPDFWIKKINISVNKAQGEGFYLKGRIDDICTEQAITGKPTIFNLVALQGKKMYLLKGKIDHVEDINDVVEFKAEGLEGTMAGIDKIDIGNVKMKNGKMGFELIGKSTEESISVNGSVILSDISYDKKEEDITYQVLRSIDKLKIIIAVNQTKENTNISITSDVLEKIKKSIEKIYGKKITEIKEKINKEIEAKTKDKLKELTDIVAKDNKELGKILTAEGDKVKAVEGYIESIKNNIQRQIKEKQSKAIEEKKQDLLKMFK